MKFPYVSEIREGKEIATTFKGYNHTNSCADGQFRDMKNMVSDDYPFLSVSKKNKFYELGIKDADRNAFAFIDSAGDLYVDGIKRGSGFTDPIDRQIVRMGSYACVFPDGKYVNAEEDSEVKDIEIDKTFASDGALINTTTNGDGTTTKVYDTLQMYLVDSQRKTIKVKPASSYSSGTPSDGAYMVEESGGSYTLKQYSKQSSMWMPVSGTYVRLRFVNREDYTFEDFKDGDGLEIGIDIDDIRTIKNKGFRTSDGKATTDEDSNGEIEDAAYDALKALFVNDDNTNNFTVKMNSGKSLYLPGIMPITSLNSNFFKKTYKSNETTETQWVFEFPKVEITVRKKMPSVDHVIECQNRLWACDTEGKEIYASKLGDPTNWNVFSGISTDSYAATVGSNGYFTGAINYKGYPMFFKQNSVVKVSVSNTGAHQLKETAIDGVQYGSHKSLVEIDGLLYYKANHAVMIFDGSNTSIISDALGVVTYKKAVGGTINEKYYLEMEGPEGRERFIYDIRKGIWTKEEAWMAQCFVKLDYYKDENNTFVNELWASDGSKTEVVEGNAKDIQLTYMIYNEPEGEDEEGEWEERIDDYPIKEGSQREWMIESGIYGFTTENKKNLSRINVRIKLANDSVATFQIKYDSMGDYQSVWQIYGRGTKTFTIPMKPHRCDHYQYRIVGRGDAEIISITRTYTEGSDM